VPSRQWQQGKAAAEASNLRNTMESQCEGRSGDSGFAAAAALA
jgi:hypothetical protein